MKQTNIEKLIEFVNVMKTRQWIQGGGEIETIHVPSLLHKLYELQQEEPSGWISVEKELPKIIEGYDCSANVIAWINGERKIMNYTFFKNEEDKWCYAWCMVYDGLDGDAEFDDNYYPTHWQPLPNPPLNKQP